ncbi:hypothetical protein CEXT_707891 [Caerostris extrusa]|uniref:Uncharacterized protein n=1 Tax=Caerostris extrusa TaxID=172846 RepID=A0AAV4TS34_CAEEX|nr:hypothetical protein CEXT_707891 [Caerostris extrusa]
MLLYNICSLYTNPFNDSMLKSIILTYKANNITLFLISPIRLPSKALAVLRKPFKCATASATKRRTLLQTQWMDYKSAVSGVRFRNGANAFIWQTLNSKSMD